MKNKYTLLIALLIVGIALLTACKKENEETINPEIDNNSTQSIANDPTNNDTIDSNEDNSVVNDENNDTTQTNEQETTQIDGKEKYLKKLSEMEEADRNEKVGETTTELEEQEEERFIKWDDELNSIYALLKEQLNPEEMDELKLEQRDWIKTRDKSAEEASEKYKGGTTETLEYVATQASLTRERCFALIAKYID